VQREYGLDSVVKLASNENPLGPSPQALAAIAAALPELHRYPDADLADVRAALAALFGVSPQHLIVGNGADELIKLIAEAYLGPGDEIVVPSPSFSEYEFAGLLMGATVVSVPLRNDYSYDLDAVLQAVTPRTKLVYLCTPNNPTGTYIPRGELIALLERLPQGVLPIVDAAYGHYADAPDYSDGIDLIREGRLVLTLQTFSKIYGLAGIRVGYAVSQPDIIAALLRVKEPFNVNALAQTAAVAALADADHVARSQAVNREGRAWLTERLALLGFGCTPSQSNFVLVRLGAEAKQLYGELMKKGVIVRYGGIWGLPEHVRVTVGKREENERLIAALADITGASPG
jgi:histidinol-phosphate aminotransferase